ncbi:MAG: type I methionyl aminopeptidase, partial [Erysipelotrichaceae bacterium]
VLDYVSERIKVGVSTQDIDDWVNEITYSNGAIPADLNFEGYPKSVCTSVNDQVCHGIPSKDVILKDGDIVNVDVSTIYKGYYSDASRMFIIGDASKKVEKFVRVAKECLEEGIKATKPWGCLGDIGEAIARHARTNGYSVVREFCGHGVGLEFHEDPYVLHYGRKGYGMI